MWPVTFTEEILIRKLKTSFFVLWALFFNNAITFPRLQTEKKKGRKHSKILLIQEADADHGQTELNNMLSKKKVLKEVNKEGASTQAFKD